MWYWCLKFLYFPEFSSVAAEDEYTEQTEAKITQKQHKEVTNRTRNLMIIGFYSIVYRNDHILVINFRKDVLCISVGLLIQALFDLKY